MKVFPEKNFRSGSFQNLDSLGWLLAGMGFIFLVCAVGLGFFLVVESLPVLRVEGSQFWLGENWWVGESFGALPMICGSLIVTSLAVILVLPVALSGALFTSEYLTPALRLKVKGVMELLAGIPGIIYGLLGVTFLTVGIKETFNLLDGNTLFTAGCLLAIMILPMVLTMSEDALHSVSSEYREAAEGLGFTKLQTALRVVLPQSFPGILGAVLLGIGRAMGETIAVMLVIGSLDRVPGFNIFVSGQTIPSKLGREAAEAIGSGLHWNALMGLGLTLFMMVAALTFCGNLFVRRSNQ